MDENREYTFMEIGIQMGNEKFFIGRLPKIGEVVEIVCVGPSKERGTLRFQLRVVEPHD